MKSTEFSKIRHYLGKTQGQLSRLLCVSEKATQSYEQGYRNIPTSIERQLLLLVALKRSGEKDRRPCWEIRECPDEWKRNCSAWEFKAGHLCWFINGTFCQGRYQVNWDRKMQLCQHCKLFLTMIPSVD